MGSAASFGQCLFHPVEELGGIELAGQFPPGNMGPKIESALRFLGQGGKEVVITSYHHLRAAAHGDAGTHIVNV